jgi:hypothetical protein
MGVPDLEMQIVDNIQIVGIAVKPRTDAFLQSPPITLRRREATAARRGVRDLPAAGGWA